MTPEQFSAFVFACVATVRPTEGHPLKLEFDDVALNEGYRNLLANDPAWKGGGTSCEFVLEPATMKLLKGSVPRYEMTLARGEINVSVLEDRERMFYEEDPGAGQKSLAGFPALHFFSLVNVYSHSHYLFRHATHFRTDLGGAPRADH